MTSNRDTFIFIIIILVIFVVIISSHIFDVHISEVSARSAKRVVGHIFNVTLEKDDCQRCKISLRCYVTRDKWLPVVFFGVI